MPRLVELRRRAPEGSAPWAFASVELAERTVSFDPWRASALAHGVTRVCPEDHRAWGLLGLAQSLLGHHRFAIHAYHQALDLRPNNPWYAHNLGHLYDIALDEPETAIPWLTRAREGLAAMPVSRGLDLDKARREVAASLAHALLGVGQASQAREVMREVMTGGPGPAHHELYREILAREDAALDAMDRPDGRPRRQPRKRRYTRSS
ncbi:MAG: hypothetical protein R3B72_45805 [Polyangiaceae bacterium]